ncbi:radical SAM/SPASM domain-containing protein [Acidovorax sp.]|uniref:radical SAM/SPASM domain-containing protein n=1 Tax=Acidovorax sp. TaxID=1872122 RepID=UPI00391CADFB
MTTPTSMPGGSTNAPAAVGSQRWANLVPEHLVEQPSPERAAELFKRSVRLVEIEVFSYCNRKCWFCPNATHDRISSNTLMPAEMYTSILAQLASIDYDGGITYSRYNEPLADKIILERIAQASRMLPRAQLHSNTNGDYLNHEYVEQLYAAGLRNLNIQIYLGNNERYDHAKIKAAGERTLRRVQLPHTLVSDIPGEWYEHRLHYQDMAIRLYGRNFETGGTSRAGEVPIHLGYRRTSPCLIPFWAVYIDHDGSTVPCCNFRSDIPAHAEYVIGNLARQPDLFLQYASRFAADFRASLIHEGVKQGLCSNCHFAEERPTAEQAVQLAGLLATRSLR